MQILRNIIEKHSQKIYNHIALFGAMLLAKSVLASVISLYQNTYFKTVDITKRYGKGSFALITGGANGIGKAFALDLASKGFNLVIIDYKQEDLEKIHAEITALNAQILIKIINIDFSAGDNPLFYEELQQKISDLDISILINNVGTAWSSFGYFQANKDTNILKAFNTNIYPTVLMTRIVVNQMMLRDPSKKCLILNLSSASALNSYPFYFLYGAAKLFIDRFMEALYLEFKDQRITNIDILTLKPYFVSTAIIQFRKGRDIIEPEQLVDSTWQQVLNYIDKGGQQVPINRTSNTQNQPLDYACLIHQQINFKNTLQHEQNYFGPYSIIEYHMKKKYIYQNIVWVAYLADKNKRKPQNQFNA